MQEQVSPISNNAIADCLLFTVAGNFAFLPLVWIK